MEESSSFHQQIVENDWNLYFLVSISERAGSEGLDGRRNEDRNINCYLLRLYNGILFAFILLFHNLNAICKANNRKK